MSSTRQLSQPSAQPLSQAQEALGAAVDASVRDVEVEDLDLGDREVASAVGQSSSIERHEPRRTSSTFSSGHRRAEYPAPRLSSVGVATEAPDRITDQRRALPDGPASTCSGTRGGKVLYVGKAESIRKRVAGHFSKPGGARVAGHGRPDRRHRLHRHRDRGRGAAGRAELHQAPPAASSTSGCATTSRTRTSGSRSTRTSRASTSRASATAATAPTSVRSATPSACARRSTCSARSSSTAPATAPEPGRASGSPCLDYYIKRCQAPCVGYISKEEYRANIESIIDFLSGRYRQIERALDQGMRRRPSDAQEFEQAASTRNRLKAVRSLLERQRISNEPVGTLDAIAVAAEGTDANAQVFQVRDGVLADRQSFYLENAAQPRRGRGGRGVRAPVLRERARGAAAGDRAAARSSDRRRSAEALAERRGAPVEVRHAERGDKRRIFELAERNARLALDQDRLRSERRRTQRIEALDGLQRALGMEQIPMRIECFDISNLMGHHTVASMVVVRGRRAQEVGLPALRDPRLGAGRLRGDGRGALAAHGAVRGAARAHRRTTRSTTRALPRCPR